MEGLMTIDQTAEFMGLSAWTVRYWIRMGKLPSVKFGRRILIEREELNRLVAENRQVAAVR
jgi:excisionase family DNA binding protein